MVDFDVLNTSESSRDRLCRSAAKCDTHCELLNIDTSPSHRESAFISTRHQHITDYYIKILCGSGASVAIYGMSGMEGQEPASTDQIDLQLPRGAADCSRMPTTEQTTPQSTAPATRFDRHEESVASDSISWRQGECSWFEMVLLDCSGSNQQTTLRRTLEN